MKNAVQITDKNGKNRNGIFEPAEKETILTFIPDETWKAAEYFIGIESRLEDFAGNNLNRLFDKDLTKPGSNEQKTFFIRKFRMD